MEAQALHGTCVVHQDLAYPPTLVTMRPCGTSSPVAEAAVQLCCLFRISTPTPADGSWVKKILTTYHLFQLRKKLRRMVSLSADILHDILKRLDGAALARAGCACADLRDISREEQLWENACRSMWPSTNHDDVRSLIVSIGGFRKFYADCFTLILNRDVPAVHTNETNLFAEEWAESDYYYDYMDELENALPSDFVSLIDVRYKDRALYSNVIWGIPSSDGANGWFSNCPFWIDVFHHSPENNENNDGEVFLSTVNDLPWMPSLEQERKYGKLWRELNDGIKLSWIIVNRKMKLAVNLSSWHPLGGQRHWPTDTDFMLRFGSVLPAKEVLLPCGVAKCILLMKFRVTSMGSAEVGEPSTLALMELNMGIEDMGGVHLNGHCSLLVLKEALSCHRSRNYDEVLESCHLYLRAQSDLKEEKIRRECRFDTLCVVSGITVFVALCVMCYRKFDRF